MSLAFRSAHLEPKPLAALQLPILVMGTRFVAMH